MTKIKTSLLAATAAATAALAGSAAFAQTTSVGVIDAPAAMLGVKATTLDSFGAVSKETATAMAVGAMERAGTDLAVAITGIAGPGGATPGKPVGLVHFAVAARDGRLIHRECRFGAIGRSAVRQRSVVEALRMLMELARGPKPPAKLRRESASRLQPRTKRVPLRRAGERRRKQTCGGNRSRESRHCPCHRPLAFFMGCSKIDTGRPWPTCARRPRLSLLVPARLLNVETVYERTG